MKNKFAYLTISILLMIFSAPCFGQIAVTPEFEKATSNVETYMKMLNERYESVGFGELYIQNYPECIEKELKTKEKVKYSMTHVYRLGGTTKITEWFHFDKDLKVLGKISGSRMVLITLETLD